MHPSSRSHYLLLLSLLTIMVSGCKPTNSSSSLSEEVSSSISESSIDSSVTTSSSVEDSSSVISYSSSFSLPEKVLSSLTISRTTWTSLTTYPTLETDVDFNSYTFSFMGAGNYTPNVIQGKASVFYLYNDDSLGTIASIVLTLSAAKTTHNLYGGTAANPTSTEIVPTNTGSLVFTYNFSGNEFSYFKFVNGVNAIYILSMVINFYTDGGAIPSSSSTSGTSTSSTTSSSSTSTTSTTSSSSSSFTTSYSGSYSYNYVEPNYTGTYYLTISPLISGSALIVSLDDLLDADSASGFSYSGLFSVFPYTDADPANPSSGKMLSFYSGTPAIRDEMNREHTWPDSRGGSYVENDPHVIRPTLTSENSARGNSFYNENSAWDPASFSNFKYRGIAARIIMYAAVKGQESGLNLVDLTTDSTGNLSMGRLSDLLRWNLQYDIDATETLRNNELVTRYGHNRNPFIDDRNYGCRIWGTTNATTRSICGM